MTATANGRVYDLDAAEAAAREAAGEPFAFTYAGSTYTMPPQSEWPMTVLRLVSQEDIGGALVQLLGQEQYDRLIDAGITVGTLNRLFEEVGRFSGVGGLPNSSPLPPPGSTPM